MKTLMQIDDLLLQALVEGDAFESVKLTALMEFQNRETEKLRALAEQYEPITNSAASSAPNPKATSANE